MNQTIRKAADDLAMLHERIDRAVQQATRIAAKTSEADRMEGYWRPAFQDALDRMWRSIEHLEQEAREQGSVRITAALWLLAILAGARLATWAAMWAAHNILVTLYATDYAAYTDWWARFVAWGLIIPK